MQQNKLILPIVHLNGTSRKELIAMRCKASNCLREAILEVLKGVFREIVAEVVALSDEEPLPGDA